MSDKNSVLELTGINETVPGRSEQRATRMVFFMAGFATAAWAALVPFAKYNTGVSDGTLGILLLCLGGGALVAMPLTGMLTARFGCRRVMVVSVLIFSAILPLLAVTSDARLLALALLLFGIGVGTTDCAMNVQAIIVEKASPRPLMSGFHGFYSVGGIAGAGAMSGMMSLGLSASAASLATTIIVLLLLTLCVRGFLTYANPQEGPAFAVPHGIVLLLGAVCFIVFLAEGAVLDWSAVYLTEYRALSEARGGLGFACFAATMTLGRLTGDRIVARLGQQRVVFTGALVAAAGILLTVWGGSWELALVGYALVGMGCANIVPVMFSAIGRQTAMPQVLAVPAVTTLGYMGVLAGPASIGGIAHHSSLAVAFIVVAIAMLAVAAVSKLIRV
ncbi:MFS transporter [Enterobacter sp.]|uniref:MFS transporter n=1 Tax=Enterobacter sp. TaxID=42895 RepID=UPI00296FCB06|nr:MFS transporter [Enterobacter sp.]